MGPTNPRSLVCPGQCGPGLHVVLRHARTILLAAVVDRRVGRRTGIPRLGGQPNPAPDLNGAVPPGVRTRPADGRRGRSERTGPGHSLDGSGTLPRRRTQPTGRVAARRPPSGGGRDTRGRRRPGHIAPTAGIAREKRRGQRPAVGGDTATRLPPLVRHPLRRVRPVTPSRIRLFSSLTSDHRELRRAVVVGVGAVADLRVGRPRRRPCVVRRDRVINIRREPPRPARRSARPAGSTPTAPAHGGSPYSGASWRPAALPCEG